MNTTPLSRVEVWQIENVLFKLYRIIQSCVDFIDPDNIGIYELASPITWIDKLQNSSRNRNIMNMEDLQSLNSQKKILSDFGTSS